MRKYSFFLFIAAALILNSRIPEVLALETANPGRDNGSPVNKDSGVTRSSNGVKPSTGTSENAPGINSAISELNYKIECLSTRHNEIAQEIETLRANSNQQKKIILEQGLRKTEDGKVKSLELELAMVRTELAQAREDIELMKIDKEKQSEPSRREWFQAPWIPVSSLGVALIALIIAL